MDYFKLAGGLLLVSSGLMDLWRGMTIAPDKHERERREKAKTDPEIQWDRFDELSYSVRLLVPRVLTWIGFIGILMWNIV